MILADDTAEGVFWDAWHFSLCDDACTIHAGIINTTVYQGAPGRVSRGGLPLPTVTMDTKPSEGAEGGGGGKGGSDLKPVSNQETLPSESLLEDTDGLLGPRGYQSASS